MSNLKIKLASQLSKAETLPEATITENESLIIIPENGEKGSLVAIHSPEIRNPVQVVPEFAITFAEAKNRLQLLEAFVKEHLTPSVDNGMIPGCPKPSLLKP